jgi:hypothetical protein
VSRRQLEYNDAGEVIPNRTEALADYHEPAGDFLRAGPLPQFVSELIGHKTALYKDKLNYKAPFGGGGCAYSVRSIPASVVRLGSSVR